MPSLPTDRKDPAQVAGWFDDRPALWRDFDASADRVAEHAHSEHAQLCAAADAARTAHEQARRALAEAGRHRDDRLDPFGSVAWTPDPARRLADLDRDIATTRQELTDARARIAPPPPRRISSACSGQNRSVPEATTPTAIQAASETWRSQSWRASRSWSATGGRPTRRGGGTIRTGSARSRSPRRRRRSSRGHGRGKVRGTYIEPSKITVAEYARVWAETRPHRPTTSRRTEMMIRLHIAGTRLGGRRLADVRPSEVQAWATDRGKVLAPATLRQAVGLLRSVYAAAVLDRLVASSPVVRVQLPRHEKERIVPLTVEQVASLAAALPERYRAMVVVQAGLGLRIGELLALRVDNVDFLRRTVRVEWQFTVGSKGERSETKTPRSKRTIPAPHVVLDALAAHLAAHGAGDDGTIFTTGTGGPLGHVYYGYNLLGRAATKAGLPAATTSHDLRHHYASVLLAAGESVAAVAERLGHEDASLVLSTYGHLMPGSDDRTRSAIDSAWDTARASCAPDVPQGVRGVR